MPMCIALPLPPNMFMRTDLLDYRTDLPDLILRQTTLNSIRTRHTNRVCVLSNGSIGCAEAQNRMGTGLIRRHLGLELRCWRNGSIPQERRRTLRRLRVRAPPHVRQGGPSLTNSSRARSVRPPAARFLQSEAARPAGIL